MRLEARGARHSDSRRRASVTHFVLFERRLRFRRRLGPFDVDLLLELGRLLVAVLRVQCVFSEASI